jgi:hypothetical protein
MSLHKPGRPAKPASKKRQQLHISLYPEDIERLDQLTDNRSEFLRQCISRAWEEKCGGDVSVMVTVPKWFLRGLQKTAAQRLPSEHASAVQTLIEQIVEDTAHRPNGVARLPDSVHHKGVRG